MAKIGNSVHETTQSSGIFGSGNAITLLGAEGGKRSFDQEFSNGDSVRITVVDTTSGDQEIMVATFTSPATLTPGATRIWTTDGGLGGSAIDWPTSGTRDVIVGLDAYPLQDLTDPEDQATGFLVRTADHLYTPRSFTTDDSTRLPVSNGDGVAADPEISGSWLAAHVFDRAAGAAASVRTFGERAIHSAGEVVYQMVSSAFEFWNDDAGTDKMARYTRTAANDYRHDVNQGGAWTRSVAVAAGVGAGDEGKLLSLDTAGADFTKGPSLSGKARRVLRVTAAETGHEYGGDPVEDSIAQILSDQASVATTAETVITDLSNVTIPGGAGNGTRRILVRIYLTISPSGGPWGMDLQVRMGTNGTIADAVAMGPLSYTVNAGTNFTFDTLAYLTVPSAATAFTLTLTRTGGSGSWIAKGFNSPSSGAGVGEVVMDRTQSGGSPPTVPGGFVHLRSVGPIV